MVAFRKMAPLLILFSLLFLVREPNMLQPTKRISGCVAVDQKLEAW